MNIKFYKSNIFLNLLLITLLNFFSAIFCATHSLAQEYPSKPIVIVSAHATGGAADTLSRIIANRLSSSIGQPVIVENRPGASTMLAAEYVSHAPSDGYTLLMATVTTLSINPLSVPKIKYDAIKDFSPITVVASTPFFLGVNTESSFKNVSDLISYARKNPNKLNFGSSGNGTSSHLAGELFNLMSNVKMVHVPYRATSTRNTDLSSGVIQVVFGNDLMPYARSGKVRILGVTSLKKLSSYPELPTVSDSGNLSGYEASVWYGLVAPSGTPSHIIRQLNELVKTIVFESDTKQKITTSLGGEVVGNSSEQFEALIKSDMQKWGEVIRSSKVKFDD